MDGIITDTLIRIRSRKFVILRYSFKLVESNYFKILTLLIILINAVVLAMSKFPIDIEYEARLDFLNLACFCYFAFELVVKMIGQGKFFFTRDFFNIFDASVILVNAVEIVLDKSLSTSIGGMSALTSLRIVRLFRLVKLARM